MGWLRGLEPPTSGITIQYSNQLSYSHRRTLTSCALYRTALANLARPAGIEPATTGLEGRCSIRLSYGRQESRILTDGRPGRWMVGAEGFEPTTSSSQSWRSTRLSYTPEPGLPWRANAAKGRIVSSPLPELSILSRNRFARPVGARR